MTSSFLARTFALSLVSALACACGDLTVETPDPPGHASFSETALPPIISFTTTTTTTTRVVSTFPLTSTTGATTTTGTTTTGTTSTTGTTTTGTSTTTTGTPTGTTGGTCGAEQFVCCGVYEHCYAPVLGNATCQPDGAWACPEGGNPQSMCEYGACSETSTDYTRSSLSTTTTGPVSSSTFACAVPVGGGPFCCLACSEASPVCTPSGWVCEQGTFEDYGCGCSTTGSTSTTATSPALDGGPVDASIFEDATTTMTGG